MSELDLSFLRDTAKHQMTVLHDDGVYRHLMFNIPGDSCYWFELVTWPGRLTISGDMGDFTFSRLRDMFEFFGQRDGSRGSPVNLSYWAEKVTAQNRSGNGVKEFDPKRFISVVVECVREHYRDGDKAEQLECFREVRHDVLSVAQESVSSHECIRAADDFEFRKFQFQDIWDHNFTEYTRDFVWCCSAIAWGIQQYHAATKPEAVAA